MIDQVRFEEILAAFSSCRPILVVGDVGVDKYTLGHVGRISPEAPVPVVEVQKEWMKLGLAANVSDNLNALQVESTLCSVVGDDANANQIEKLLEDVGLKTWGLVRDADRMTTFKERIVTDIQQICRVDYETKSVIAPETVTRFKKRFSELIDAHSALIIEDYGKGLLAQDLLAYIISEAKERNQLVALDPSRTTPPMWYKGVGLLKPNRIEAELMVNALGYQEKEVEKMAQILMDKLKLEKIVITLGAQGMGMIDAANDAAFRRIPTVAREVFDVSGAGDTAISAIAGALASGATLEEAAWIGNCASGVVVGKKGTALVTQEELKHFFRRFI